MSEAPPLVNPSARNRLVYILVALHLGILGTHDYYSGHYRRGLVKLGLLAACFLAMAVLYFGEVPDVYPFVADACSGGLIALELWAIVDAIRVTQDADGEPFIW
jgi:TM2 domain-containing membrane protein YozV